MSKFEELYESIIIESFTEEEKHLLSLIKNVNGWYPIDTNDKNFMKMAQKLADKDIIEIKDFGKNDIQIKKGKDYPKNFKSLYESKNIPTIKDILNAFGKEIDEEQAKEVLELMEYTGSAKKAEENLEKINKIINNHGVEAIRAEEYHDSYFQDAIAIYSNSGDTYAPTILFDIDEKEFELTTVGDFIEKKEKEGVKIK